MFINALIVNHFFCKHSEESKGWKIKMKKNYLVNQGIIKNINIKLKRKKKRKIMRNFLKMLFGFSNESRALELSREDYGLQG